MNKMESSLKADMAEIGAAIRVMDSRLRRVEAVINRVSGMLARNRDNLQAVFDEIDNAEGDAM